MVLLISSSIRSFRIVPKASHSILERPRNCTPHLANSFVRSIHYHPLRILFCGADELSIVSLEALHRESERSLSNIASIDVVCRPGKPTGRGLKRIRHPPIKDAAESLGLPVHQLNTFTGWKLPSCGSDFLPLFDLVVAVSFGLLVPPRILNETTYGGINVHPSLLPSFRGPAPLHWIMLTGETHTGVTLQTLHPTKFDEGVVLDRTPEPGVPIPNPASYTYADLQSMAAAMAADMLVKAIRERSFIRPYRDIGETSGKTATRPASFAPKIEPRMRCLDFQILHSSQIMRMNRAVAPLWAEARRTNGDRTFIIFGPDLRLASVADLPKENARIVASIEPGLPYVLLDGHDCFKAASTPLMINTIDGHTLIVPMLKMPGTTYRPAAALAQTADLLAEPSRQHGERVRLFNKIVQPPEDIGPYVKSLWTPAARII